MVPVLLGFLEVPEVQLVVGSGLIAFAINTIYSDLVKQANVDVTVKQMAYNGSMVDTDINIENSGREPAKDVLLTLETIYGEMFKPTMVLQPEYYWENVTFLKLNRSITLGERLSPEDISNLAMIFFYSSKNTEQNISHFRLAPTFAAKDDDLIRRLE